MDASKSIEPDEINPKILKYLSTNENFNNAISKLYEKCVEYEMIPYIWKTEILKGSMHSESNYRPVSLTCNLYKVFEKLIRNHIRFYKGRYKLLST